MSSARRAVATKSDVWDNKRQVATAKVLVALPERIRLSVGAMNLSVPPKQISAGDI